MKKTTKDFFKSDGSVVTLEFVSCNHNKTLWRDANTYVSNGYLYNIYSQYSTFFSGRLKLHKKLKIYCQKPVGGYYVKAGGIRCYMNNLMEENK